MRFILIVVVLHTALFGLQVDEEDYKIAQTYVATMKKELDTFKRLLVKYDFLNGNSETNEAKELKITLLTNKRLYNSTVDDLARLAFKSLYNEIKKPRKVHVKVTQSCGNASLQECKAKALELSKEKAIEENGAGLMESQMLLENNVLMEDKIFSQYTGVIKQFQITEDRIIEGGIGYALEADVTIEGNIPASAIESIKPDKITWNFEKNFDKFPSIPFVLARTSMEESEDKITNWLGLKQERNSALFCMVRLAPQYNNTGTFASNFLQNSFGLKAGYEFANWSLYVKVFYALSQTLNVPSSDYFFENITAGVQVYLKGFNLGVSWGIAQQEHYLKSGNDFSFIDYKNIYLSFEGSYRIWLSEHWTIDLGIEIGQLLALPGVNAFTNNSALDSKFQHTTGLYTAFADFGFRF